MKIFITGAAGFVGTHLIHSLKSPENRIFGSFYPKKPEKSRKEEGVNLFFLDIRNRDETSSAIKDIRPDWVVHLAAVSNVSYSWEDREETLKTNIMGTFHICEAVRQFTPRARVLFISSSDVYGIHPDISGPFRETDAVFPVNPYALTKIGGESLSQFYSQIEKCDIVISRSFPHTGPGQRPEFVCSDWARQIALIEKEKQDPVINVGNIDIRRDFLDVRDVVKAYIGLLEKGKIGEAYNVCSGKAVTLRWILHQLVSLANTKIQYQVDPEKLRKADIPLLHGDNKKIKQATGWKPQIPLQQTLLDLLEHWRNTA